MKQLLKQEDPRYKIDESRKVFIYKNLHKDCWSVKQDGLVKMHATDLSLFDCSFRVNQRGRQQVLEERRKNVHAGISGYIDLDWDEEDISREGQKTKLATYNPYKYKSFVRVEDDTKPVFWASTARLSTAKSKGEKDKVYFVPCIDSANKL
jgi:hypothetical protein